MNIENVPLPTPESKLIQVVVSIKNTEVVIDPWDNCPDEVAREEGRICNDCEFWGNEVRGIDWTELSLCNFGAAEN